MEGWVKLQRKLMDWEWYKDSNMVHLFIHLLLSANHEKGKWQGIEISRGQLVTGVHTLSERTGISTRSVRTCLSKLKMTGELTSTATNKYSLITIVKYEEYQFKETKATSKLTNERQATDRQPTTNKNDKEEEEEKEKGKIGLIFFNKEIKMEGEYFLEGIRYGNQHQRNNGGLSERAIKEHCTNLGIVYAEQ